jgi:hypothetical protein
MKERKNEKRFIPNSANFVRPYVFWLASHCGGRPTSWRKLFWMAPRSTGRAQCEASRRRLFLRRPESEDKIQNEEGNDKQR